VGTLIAAAIMVWAIIKNNPKFKDFAAGLVIVLAVSAIVVNTTGESAEETVEKIAGVAETSIEAHEDAAKPALILTLAAGLLCAVYLFFSLRKLPVRKSLFVVCTVLTVLAFGAMARAGYYGGQIRHTEIAGDANAVPVGLDNHHED
jgi:bacteriorhodopsin